jgi:MFS family permease
MIADSQQRPGAWFVVGLLLPAGFSNHFMRLLPMTMHGSLVAAIPMTEAQFGLLTSCLFWTYGLMSPFGGFLADRFSRSWVIVTSMFIWSVTTWLTSYTKTFEQLFILRSLMGLSEACYLPAALALINDYHGGRTRSLASGIHQAACIIGIGLSGLGGWLAERYSWHYAFSLSGLASLAYCAPLALLLRDVPRGSPGATAAAEARPKVRIGEALVSLFNRGSFVLMLVSSALLGAITWPLAGWMPVFLQEHFHLTQGVAGISGTGYMTAAVVPGLLIGGFWADKWSRTNRRSRMFVPAIGLFVSSPCLLLAANTNVFMLAVLGLVLCGLFQKFTDGNLMPILCEVVDPRYRATSYGLCNLMNTGVAGCGFYFSGVVRDSHVDLQIVFDVLVAVSVLCALMFYSIKPTTAQAEKA